MDWNVEVTDEFRMWWSGLSHSEQDDISASAGVLSAMGPYPRFPHTAWINHSKHRTMREMRIRSGGNPFSLLYAFDPKRVAILLIGGEKGGKNRGQTQYIALADRLYDSHLEELDREGLH